MKKNYNYILPYLLFPVLLILCGWGSTGHKLISTDATHLFKGKAEALNYISDMIIAHASDADYRRGGDPTEAPKHYIDIDSYPEFVSSGKISMYYDSVTALHGQSFVTGAGTLPWAILNAFDSLKAAFSRNDWDKAGLFAADLGHYVGDSHMPLHLTENYNGESTNQSGVHSRYESDLVNQYSSQIKYDLDSLKVIKYIRGFVFSYIYKNYTYKDSVLNADKQASSYAGTNRGTVYLQKFWELAGAFTDTLMKNASCRLADLIYTAWVEAGSPVYGVSNTKTGYYSPKKYYLGQNYPNPFNPVTTIGYTIPKRKFVSLKVFNILGSLVATLVDEEKSAGSYEVKFDPAGLQLSSGIYFYIFDAGGQKICKKMCFLK